MREVDRQIIGQTDRRTNGDRGRARDTERDKRIEIKKSHKQTDRQTEIKDLENEKRKGARHEANCPSRNIKSPQKSLH